MNTNPRDNEPVSLASRFALISVHSQLKTLRVPGNALLLREDAAINLRRVETPTLREL